MNIFYGRMISFLLASLIIFLGVLLTCYSLLEAPLQELLTIIIIITIIVIIIVRVFCPKAALSLKTKTPSLQFCPKADLPSKTQEPRLQIYYNSFHDS